VFGNTAWGRPAALDGVEGMVGHFINTLPLRVRVPADERLGAWLARLQRTQARAGAFEHTSHAQLRRWSQVPADMPLFESMFMFENYPVQQDGGSEGAGPALRLDRRRVIYWPPYPLSLIIASGLQLELSLKYDASRFDEATIGGMLDHLVWLLEQMASDADVRLGELAFREGAASLVGAAG
jgi:non-ribosomal peptide synthetase component F